MEDKSNPLCEQECDQIDYLSNLHRRANMININSHLNKAEIHKN